MFEPASSPEVIDEILAIVRKHCGEDEEQRRLALWDDDIYWFPEGAVDAMLWDDALGTFPLPDDVVARLWELVYQEGFPPEMAVSDEVLAKARPGRRTRPEPPPPTVRFPLNGGGHRAGGQHGGKTEFPTHWRDDRAMAHVMSVAKEPDGAVAQPDGTFRAWGTRDGVQLRVIVSGEGEALTAYPLPGPGVVHNPLDELRQPWVERLTTLLAHALPPDLDEEIREGFDELLLVGEWDQVLLQLHALGVRPEHERELNELLAAAGLAGLTR